YETRWQFTPAGWLRVHVIRADITRADIGTDLLLAEKGLAITEHLSNMAGRAGAVAAINGDFFFGRGIGAPLGPVVTGGRLVSSPSRRQDLSVFALLKDGGAAVGRLLFEGQVTSETGQVFALAGWNKPGESYQELYGFDHWWAGVTPTKVPEDCLAAIIEDGMVVDLLPATGGIDIQADQQILLGAQAAAQYLQSNLIPGSRVNIDISTDSPWPDLAWAVGGGTVLIKEGQIVPFTHEISGNNPRSAVGISADGRELILAAVDGRQEESRGLTQTEWAAELLKLGCYQALNLDGGGSTTVLARLPGEGQAKVVNSLSERTERSVSNGIGIFSRAPKGELAGLTIVIPETRLVPAGRLPLAIKGYDANYNPLAVEADKVSWLVEPAELGAVQGNVFTAHGSGKGKLIATIGPARGEAELEVIGPVVRLELVPEEVALAPEGEATITAVAYDAVGNRAPVRAEDLAWEVLGDIGTVVGGRFKGGLESRAGAVEARWSDIAARTLVTVGTVEMPLLYFEALSGISAAVYPAEVKGNISLAAGPEPVHGGNHSLRLDYDFSTGSGTKAAYIVFDQGMALPGRGDELSLMVHGDGNGNWLRALLADKKGHEFTVDLARQVDWNDWKELKVKLPPGDYPLALKRIYLVEPDQAKQGAGTIYFDDLALSSSLPFAEEMKLAANPFPDRQYTPVPLQEGQSFLVIGALPQEQKQLEWVEALKEAAHSHRAQYLVCLKPVAEATKLVWEETLGLPIKPVGMPLRWDEGTATCYALNARGGTLVQGNAQQWQWLQKDLAQLEGKKQVFIFLEQNPFAGAGGFSSGPEADLLRRRLQETGERLGALVWTFSPGESSGTVWEGGVRHQRLAETEPGEKPRLALITLTDGNATYTGLKY
ncbi:MAG TPA: phosphodiester glycosidase family protein, partial [bacterium]|nr:phosphodiester glycosidase family protein [bacterium]